MSEEEKLLQVGRLAEEYSKLRGELHLIEEKVARTGQAYAHATQSFQTLSVRDGKLFASPQPGRPTGTIELQHLLDEHQLVELLVHRENLRGEVKETGERLKALAPHLLN